MKGLTHYILNSHRIMIMVIQGLQHPIRQVYSALLSLSSALLILLVISTHQLKKSLENHILICKLDKVYLHPPKKPVNKILNTLYLI